ncbi:Subtilisin-like protease SBT4.12 [Dichanthelium oligosanthes]|uniref:Subtilisin-like protease SBT4.12 n=1 Tax=Dichanthelium oligosanthes TaxID=888268 RepID=A0A1E5WMV7_9POAL|nr:Subtilisin-like protease SBT4.12 [Dichanthelium oligosanthes]
MAGTTPLLVLLAALSAFFCHAAALHTLADGGASIDSAAVASAGGDDSKVYIVFTERQPASAGLPETDARAAIASFHHDLLSNDVLDANSNAPDRVVYHYTRSLHGFAARLTVDEKHRLAGKAGVLSIHEKKVYKLHTTRSWDYLGLPQQQNDSTKLPFENDVIIGMVDSGVWPELESFADEGLPPPPAKWKGVCSKNFTCNNKIIGARAYRSGNTTVSPRDDEGHGTHTASTAAGRAAAGASLGGLAAGTARSAVPGARLAIYKVCWPEDCSSEDILAAFDDAIADGVDVISASLGYEFPLDYAEDMMAVGAFHAMKRGIVTSVSAGNSGPSLASVSNVAPWTVSTAAAADDRKIISELVLGSGKRIEGSAVTTVFPDLGQPSLLIDTGSCFPEDINGKRLKGAVLLCGKLGLTSRAAIKSSGADGAIVYPAKDYELDTAFSFPFPLVMVKEKDYGHIIDYYNSTRHAMATVMKSVTVKNAAAPSVADFSSRGPNRITHGILKPDISAPGVDILAAWSPEAPLSGTVSDDRRAKYNIVSGTSMACPHVTGAAAYVKSVHPSWSHAAVLSALVTTATPMKSGEPEAEHAYGAGQVNPVAAPDPGLVYDATEADYVSFLCAQGYNSSELAAMTGRSNANCSTEAKGSAVGDLNYPSIAVPVLNYGVGFAAEFPRTVTNVGSANAVYRANVTTVPGVNVTVTPSELAFSTGKEKLSFTVSVSGTLVPVNGTTGASASLVWSDGKHQVRSPIYVFPYKHVM